MKGKYFELGSKVRRDLDTQELRRFSQLGTRHLEWSDVSIPEEPQTAPPALETYGPFEIIFSDQESSDATFEEKLLTRRQRIHENAKRARETKYIELSNGAYIPSQLLRVIAKQKAKQAISLEDFADSLFSSNATLEEALRMCKTEQIPGSDLFAEPPAAPTNLPAIRISDGEDRDTIRKSVGLCLDFLRLHWDVVPDDEFYKVEWSLGGKSKLPRFGLLKNKLNRGFAELNGLGSNILKWVLDLLAFLFKAAGDCTMIPYEEAHRLVRSISDTLLGIHVPVDYIGEECRRIWGLITDFAGGLERKAGGAGNQLVERSRRQISRARNLGPSWIRSPQNMHGYLPWIGLLLPIVLWYIPLEPLRALIHHCTTQIVLLIDPTLQTLFTNLPHLWQALQRGGYLPYLCLITLITAWWFRHDIWDGTRRGLAFTASLPTLGLVPLSEWSSKQIGHAKARMHKPGYIKAIPRNIGQTKAGLQKTAETLHISSTTRTVGRVLYWLVPFVAVFGILWPYRNLESAREIVTVAAKDTFSVVEEALESIKEIATAATAATVATKDTFNIVEEVLETTAPFVQSIPFSSTRNILLDSLFPALGLFCQWKDAIAPHVGATSIFASIVIVAVILDRVFGPGHSWNFLLGLRNGVTNVLSEIPNFFGWLIVNLRIIFYHYWAVFLGSSRVLIDSVSKTCQTMKNKVAIICYFVTELFRDCRDCSWERLKNFGRKVTNTCRWEFLPSAGWWSFVKFIGAYTGGWIAQTLAVAVGVWLAMFVCGLCVSCSKNDCFARSEKTPDGLYSTWSSIQEVIAMGMKEQKEVLSQIGNVLARYMKQMELKESARDERDELLSQTLQKIAQMMEEQQKGGWSLRRIFGYGS